MGVKDVLGAVSGIGGLVGSAGKGKGSGPTQLSGFASLPQNIQDLLQGPILEQITTQLNKPYTPLPMRTVNASDYDPVFGSQAVQGLQDYYNNQPTQKNTAGNSNVSAANSMTNYEAPTYRPNGSTGVTGIPDSNPINKSDPRYGQTLPWFMVEGAPDPGPNNPGPAYVNPSNPGSGISGLTSSDMAKLKQILSGMGGQA